MDWRIERRRFPWGARLDARGAFPKLFAAPLDHAVAINLRYPPHYHMRGSLFFFLRREFFMTLDALFTDFLVALLAKVHPFHRTCFFTDPSTYDREAANLNLLLFI